MIVFDKLWLTMKEKGFSTYKLREQCGIDSKTIRRLKANENIETKTIDKICSALGCRIEDIAEFVEIMITKERRCRASPFFFIFYLFSDTKNSLKIREFNRII